MNKLMTASIVVALVLLMGYGLMPAFAGACCGKTTCQTEAGVCCVDGICKCPVEHCCVDGECSCSADKGCDSCSCA